LTNGFNLQKVFGAERIFLDLKKEKKKGSKIERMQGEMF